MRPIEKDEIQGAKEDLGCIEREVKAIDEITRAFPDLPIGLDMHLQRRRQNLAGEAKTLRVAIKKAGER